jgi:diphosphomevalonate decarboxylase
VTLGGLDTLSAVRFNHPGQADTVLLDGVPQSPDRFSTFFAQARKMLETTLPFAVSSHNSFPSSAGLASSSSGFAALALACTVLARAEPAAALPPELLDRASTLARCGSASAARAVYGGFTMLPTAGLQARPLHGPEHWPDLRILVVVTSRQPKDQSSRDAMERTRKSSPYYGAWTRDARQMAAEALRALERRDLERLGTIARLSYLRMHASAMAANPPILYWLPASLAVIQACAALRAQGISAWETMDAGPQVKILCTTGEMATIRAGIVQSVPGVTFIEAWPGRHPDIQFMQVDPFAADTRQADKNGGTITRQPVCAGME